MKYMDTPIIEPLEFLSASSSSMSCYDVDINDLEIELSREKVRLDTHPHIVVCSMQEETSDWEHDER